MQKLELIDLKKKNSPDFIAIQTLDKPAQANALDPTIMATMTQNIANLHKNKNCRALIITGIGKHFCAGAHLKWMQDSAKLSYEQNIEEAHRLTNLYESIAHCPFPTISVVRGAAYGGGVGLASVSDIVIADQSAKFCLSEVKLGLIPAVILPYVKQRMPLGQLKKYGLTGAVIKSDDLTRSGLVDTLTEAETLAEEVTAQLQSILQAAPAAQHEYKKLIHKLQGSHDLQSSITAETIARVRAGEEAKSGLTSFFNKTKPTWICELKNTDEVRKLFAQT